MKIVIISSDKYPDGGASANRHLAYAKGLVESGHSVTFILLSPQPVSEIGWNEDGLSFKPAYKKNLFSKMARNHSSLVPIPSIKRGKRILLELNSKNAVNVVILLDTHVWMLTPFLKVCKKYSITVIHERTEYPLVTIKRKVFGKVHLWLYKHLILNNLDGIFVINSALKNYFTNLTRQRIPVEVINMIVDPSRFDKPDKGNHYPYRYIAYCGSMGPEKDGTDILINAFCTAVNKLQGYEDLKLMLIGRIPDESVREVLNRAINDCDCTEKVVFSGFIQRQSIPEILNNAMALALARPAGIQAEGGFPTKLGEYLATGKPVIVTNTGEIGHYLKDGYNAFLAEPGSAESFSGKIREVFGDYAKATEIGQNGKKLIYNEFNYLHQANRLIDFIHSVKNA